MAVSRRGILAAVATAPPIATLPERRQTRRPDVRLHRGPVKDSEWIHVRGLPITRPSRIAADLLADREEPEAAGRCAPRRRSPL
jgi:hypothetical protein